MNARSMPSQAEKQLFCEVRAPFDESVVGSVRLTQLSELPAIIEHAKHGAKLSSQLSRNQRAEILFKTAELVLKDATNFAKVISLEAGKTIRQARKEVARCVNTLRLSAEEAKRHVGEIIPFDAYAGSENRSGYYTHEPLGVILAITPFNDPLNLVAHKLGPALAAGNAVILKPSLLAPLSAQHLAECFWQAGVARDMLQVVHGEVEVTAPLVRERSIRMISFTGGPVSGEAITREAGLKKMAMDLGGNAPVIVMADCDLNDAAESCVSGAFWAAGQNCIGTQRIFIERSVYARFSQLVIEMTTSMKVGNPLDEDSDMGPMINEAQAQRIERWVNEAIDQGAKLLCGNRREGALYYPTILTDVPVDARVWCEEVFAPVVILTQFDDINTALEAANDTESSLQAGIFTSNLETALSMAEKLEAGGVMINDSSDYRFDGMPFGGFKYGSLGREGVRFSISEMSQPKVICFKRNALQNK